MIKTAALLAATAFFASAQNLSVGDKAWQQAMDKNVQGRGRPTTRGQANRGRKGPKGGLKGSKSSSHSNSPSSSKTPDAPDGDQRLTDLEDLTAANALLIEGLRTDVDA